MKKQTKKNIFICDKCGKKKIRSRFKGMVCIEKKCKENYLYQSSGYIN